MPKTPAHIIDHITGLAAYLQEQGYGCAIVSPSGGASFHQRSVFDEKADLFAQITILEARVAQLEEDGARKDATIRRLGRARG